MFAADPDSHDLTISNDRLQLRTEEPIQFIDITIWAANCVRRSGIRHGLAQIHARHTTAAIIVNENEPLLLDDFKAMLERLAPGNGAYGHDDPARRRAHLAPEDRPNGHAHARALLLGTSKPFDVVEGRLQLGRWQSIFLVELDGPRKRSVSLTVMGYRWSPA